MDYKESSLAHFFNTATPEERAEVFKKVGELASKRQLAIIEQAKKMNTGPLPKNTLRCPDDHEGLHFEIIGNIRIVRDGYLNARCVKCGRHYQVVATGDWA